MGDINLDPGPFQTAKIAMDTAQPTVPVGPEIADKRAAKAYYGLGTITGDSQQDILDKINGGNEPRFREQAASAVDTKNFNQRIAAVQQAATSGQLGALKDWSIAKTDPNAVIEENYSKWFNRFQSPLFQFREYVNTQSENADSAVHNQGWLPWLGEQALNLIPGYYGIRMGWAAQDYPGMFKALLGDLSYSDIYSDPATAKEKFDKGMASLAGNPSLQSAFAHAVQGLTNSEQIMNRSFSLMDVAGAAGALKFGTGVAKNIHAFNTIRRTMREAYEAGIPGIDNPLADKLGSQGETSESAIVQAADNLVNMTRGGDDTKATLSGLPSTWRIHEEALASGGGGRYGSGLLGTIQADFFKYKNNVVNMLTNIMRVNRTPIVEASKDVVRVIRENMRGKYYGPSNTLMDIEGPEHDVASNSYFFHYIMGSTDKDPFDSAQEAFNASQRYGYPAADTLRDRVNREVGPKLAELDYKIKQLIDEKKTPPAMEDDVHGINYHEGLQAKIDELNKQRDDLLAYHAEHLIGPDINIPGSTIRQLGPNKYVIAHRIPMSEIEDVVRNGLIFPSDYKGHLGTTLPHMDEHIKSTLAWMRTPGETLAPSEVNQRVIATHGAGQFLKIAQANSHIIAEMPRRFRKDFRRVLEANTSMDDPHDGLPGYFFEDIPQLEEYYQSHIGRMPDESEIRAYFAHKANWDYDRILRGLLSARNKNSRGVEQHSISFKDPKTGMLHNSPFIDAVSQKNLPGGHDLVAVMRPGGGIDDVKMYYADSKGFTGLHNKLDKDITEGRLQVAEIYDVQARPLASFFGDNRAIRYVITNKFERRPLQLEDQIGRRGGGHWDWDYNWAIKQPKMIPERSGSRFRWRYEGDTFLAWVENERMGRDYLKHLNQIREYMDAKEYQQAENYHKAHMDMPWEDHRKMYFPTKVNGVLQEPMFNTKDPFQLVRKDQKIVDVDNTLKDRYNAGAKDLFYDATREGSLARTQQIQYTGERDSRDVFAVSRSGDWRNPVFGLRRAEFTDPMVTMDKALSRIINSSFMEDYKMMGAEHWLKNAEQWLKDKDLIKNAPWYVFHNFKPDTSFVNDAPPEVKAMLTNNWKKINDFIGMPSRVEQFIDRAVENIASDLYGKTGMIVPARYLPKLKNPFQFMRSAVFDMKFLYSPGTFFTQLSTFINVVGMAGIRTGGSTFGATIMHQLSRMNADPNILSHMGKLMEGFGWRPGEFEEARNALLTWTNFAKVGQEHALLDSMIQNRTIDNAWHHVEYFGRKFFEEGADNTRIASFYAAFRRFRDKNPTATIGRQQREQIMAEAADFDHNMSRAFNSSLHTGGASWFGQFYAYAMRLFELMTGKRLAAEQKIRLAAVSSVMWGVPMGGLGLYAFPIGDMLKQQLITNYGYTPGNNIFEDVFMKGMPAVMHSMATGQWYDYEKFGTKFDPLIEVLEGDAQLWQIMGGATMQTFANAWKRTSPLVGMGWDIMQGNLKLTWHDLISPLQEASAINDEERLRYALSTGQWISKNGTYLSDVDNAAAWFMTMTGITKTDISNTGMYGRAIHNQEDFNTSITNRYVQEMRLANVALNDNDRENWRTHLNNAQVWFDKLPQGARAGAMAASMRAMTPLVDRQRWNLFMNPKIVPPGLEEQRSKQFQQMNR